MTFTAYAAARRCRALKNPASTHDRRLSRPAFHADEAPTLVGALAVLFLAAAALALSPGSAAKPNITIPEKQHMGPVDPPAASSSGMIAPKADTDPGMTKKPPPQDPKETPVIPPPKGNAGEPDVGAK